MEARESLGWPGTEAGRPQNTSQKERKLLKGCFFAGVATYISVQHVWAIGWDVGAEWQVRAALCVNTECCVVR